MWCTIHDSNLTKPGENGAPGAPSMTVIPPNSKKMVHVVHQSIGGWLKPRAFGIHDLPSG
jgi:hypothetical protein